MAQRILAYLVDIYVDEANQADLHTAMGQGQLAIFAGAPFCDYYRQQTTTTAKQYQRQQQHHQQQYQQQQHHHQQQPAASS